MTSRRIALVRYTPDYFLSFGQALETAGFEVFWINSLRSDCCSLQEAGVPDTHWLDTTAEFRPEDMALDECRERLGALERGAGGPRIYDIIMMDRLLRKKPADFAIRYLAHLEKTISAFLTGRRIELVTSGRDTALQLLTMLVCRRLGIPWVVPTRARIPQELYGFCQQHDTESLISFRPVSTDDRVWAAACLTRFQERALKPALKKSARNFMDVVRLLPRHAEAFLYEFRKSREDKGNDYARYTLPDLIVMYVRRRLNMLAYKFFPFCQTSGQTPFALYALHTQPESSIDVVGSYFSDQIHLVRTIARSLPATHELYVKVHPTDVDGREPAFYHQLAAIPGVRLIDHRVDSWDLLQRTSLLFALTGTIAYEAGLLGRPAIVFARNFFNRLPTVHYCSSPPDLPALIDRILSQELPVNLEEQQIEFLAHLRTCCFDGEVNRTYGASSSPLRIADLASLRDAYCGLAQKLVAG